MLPMNVANCPDSKSQPPIERYNVGILLFDGVEVLDFGGPFEVFSRTRLSPGIESRRSEETAPFRVFTVAKNDAPVTATGELQVVPRYSFEQHLRSNSWSFLAGTAHALS